MASDAHLPGSLSDLDHHASRKFRLTRQSAAELIATALLAIVSLILIAVTVLGFIASEAMRETSTYVARYQFESARTAAANAVEADSSNVYAFSALGGASLFVGDFELAQQTYEKMGGLSRMRYADAALGRAVAVLTDPATAGTTAAITQARSLLGEVSDDPDARVILGQLALDEGNYEEARNHFESALRGGGDPPAPSIQGAIVAYNGLGVAMLADPAVRRNPDRIAETIGHFHSALAYRQPWAPPLINLDRAVGLWLRAKSADAAQRWHFRDLLREARELHGASLEEFTDYDLRRYSERTQWPEVATFPGPGERDEVQVGRIPLQPTRMSRQMTLRPAVLDVRLAAVAEAGALEAVNALLREVNEELSSTGNLWGGDTWATEMNAVIAQMRGLQAGIRARGRTGRLRAVAPVLRKLVEEVERTPQELQPALLVAYWVTLGEEAEPLLAPSSVSVLRVVEQARQMRLFERLAEFEGTDAPSRRWLRFVEVHLEGLERFARLQPSDFDVAETMQLAELASHLVAHLPADSAPSAVRDVPLPDAAEGIPHMPGTARYGEVATLVRLYERLMRDLAREINVRASRADVGSAERDLHWASLVMIEGLRARLLGYLESTGAETLDGGERRRQVGVAANHIRDGRRNLGSD